jgi:hypothetical protein
MPDSYQLSTQINDLYQRLAALEAQVANLSQRLEVPFTSPASGAVFDPRLSPAPDPRAMGTGFDPMIPVPPPAPDPSFGAPSFGAPSFGAPSFGAPSVAAPSFGAPSVAAPSVAAPSANPLTAGLTPDVVDLVRRGKKIQAIKLYRELTHLDLKTAKDVIDRL